MSDTPTVIGLAVSDGTRRWQLADHSSAGVSAGGRVLVSRVGAVDTSALAVTTGTVLWTRKAVWAGQTASPAGDSFFASGSRNEMVCVDAATGAVRWTAARKASPLVATDGRRVYRAMAKGIEVLDAGTGARRCAVSLPGNAGQPVRAGGLLYTTVDGGKPLGTLHAAGGARASGGTQIGAVVGGNVVVTGGRLYAIKRNTLRVRALTRLTRSPRSPRTTPYPARELLTAGRARTPAVSPPPR